MPDITNPFFAVIVRWIENAARLDDKIIFISESNNDTEFEKIAIKAFSSESILLHKKSKCDFPHVNFTP